MREVKLEAGARIELTSLRTRRRVGCTVDKLLGVGGTAKVYSGCTDEGHQVVLKAQRYQGQLDPSFEVEMELFKKLFHRNIVHSVGVATTPGGYLVLGFRRAYQNPLLLLTKASVSRRDRRATYPSLSLDTAIDFAYELLNALDYLERLGFVHHDVKLANILVDVAPRERPLGGGEVFGEVVRREYRGVLIDFGATRSRAYLEAWNRGEAPDGLAPLITPIYAPPESLVETRQPDGKLRVTFDPSLDVYAAALVIYALVTGHPPYSHLRAKLDLEDIESVISVKSAERRAELTAISQETVQRAVLEDTRFLSGDRHSFDQAFHRFLAQRLHPDPAQRGTAADMKRDFERLACIRQLRDEAPPQSGARAGASGTASTTRPVFLPFAQELVVVGEKGGEHPLLRAARSFGMSPTSPGEAVGSPTAPEPPTPTPEGDTATASEDELDWLATIGKGAGTEAGPAAGAGAGVEAAWLDDMDATGSGSGSAPPPGASRPRGTRREAKAPASPAGSGVVRRSPEPGSDVGKVPAPAAPAQAPSRDGSQRAPAQTPSRDGSQRVPAATAAPPSRGEGRPPPSPAAGHAPHCLVSPALGDPVLLSRERRYVVGRDPGVELRIRSDLISRRHAEVSWAGKWFQVEDLGSLNGTLVNGQRIAGPTPLHDGDRIGVGGFELRVRTLQSGEIQPPAGAEGPPVKGAAGAPGGGTSPDFAGDLGKTPIREVLALVETRGHSGTLSLKPPRGAAGKLFFDQGRLIHAEQQGQKPREAALRLMTLKAGRFVFSGGAPDCPRSLDEPLEALWDTTRRE